MSASSLGSGGVLEYRRFSADHRDPRAPNAFPAVIPRGQEASISYPGWDTIRNSTYARQRYFPMLEADEPTFMGLPHAISPADLKGVDAVIIGAPYVASWTEYAGVPKSDWIAGPKRVRQQSIRYASGYIQDFDLDVCALPIVVGQNSPCGSYAIAKPIAERTKGNVGVISLDTHWDSRMYDRLTMDARIAGSGDWKRKMYDFHANITPRNLVEIGERGMLESKEIVRDFLRRGAHFYPMWKVRTELGIDGLCRELQHAYAGTDAVYVHFDMDVLGGAGPAPGDILGELAEPIGMSDYEVIRVAHEIGKRGLAGLSFICIPPGSAVIYRTIVYIIMYMLAGKVLGRSPTTT